MKWKLLHETDGLRTFVLIFDKGDDPIPALTEFAADQRLDGASLSGIGGFKRATLGYFDPEDMDYLDIRVDEQCEVLSLLGDIAVSDGAPVAHAHVVLGRRDGAAVGGHLVAAEVWPTLEIIAQEAPAHLRKQVDAETGLPLIAPLA